MFRLSILGLIIIQVLRYFDVRHGIIDNSPNFFGYFITYGVLNSLLTSKRLAKYTSFICGVLLVAYEILQPFILDGFTFDVNDIVATVVAGAILQMMKVVR